MVLAAHVALFVYQSASSAQWARSVPVAMDLSTRASIGMFVHMQTRAYEPERSGAQTVQTETSAHHAPAVHLPDPIMPPSPDRVHNLIDANKTTPTPSKKITPKQSHTPKQSQTPLIKQADFSGEFMTSVNPPSQTEGAFVEESSDSGTPDHVRLSQLSLDGDWVMPEYPRLARKLGHEGLVVVRLWINRLGRVKHAQVIHSSGFHYLDEAALTAAQQMKFKPYLSQSAAKTVTQPLAQEATADMPFNFVLSR